MHVAKLKHGGQIVAGPESVCGAQFGGQLTVWMHNVVCGCAAAAAACGQSNVGGTHAVAGGHPVTSGGHSV